jgi:hypothetical protein
MKKIKSKLFWVILFMILVTTLFYLGSQVLMSRKQADKPPNSLMTHVNETYGFSISYPKNLIPETTFQKYPSLGDTWMAGASEESKGKALLCIPIFRVTNESSYPRDWNTEVRIGITTDPIELQTFLTKSSYTETPPKEEIINGIIFYVFPIQDAGMMKFLSGFSYRTIHDGVGYAIERIKTGSIYRDSNNSSKDIPDSTLDSYFNQTSKIVKSFQFIGKQ